MKTFKVRYISDQESVFLEKGQVYEGTHPADDKSKKMIGVYLEDMDEPGFYARPANCFEIVEE